MPIYAYRCAECGHQVEVLQKVSDEPLRVCPSCHRAALAKQVTAAGFQLKGSGWYVTDFRDGKTAKKEASKAEAPAAGDAGKADAGAPAGKKESAGPADSASVGAATESKPSSPPPSPPPPTSGT